MHKYFNFSKNLLVIFFAIHLVIFHPIYLGYKYFNSENNQSTIRGTELPQEYSDLEKELSTLNTEARILSMPFSGGYVYKNWGYFGPDIVPWISGDNFVTPPAFSGLSLESSSQQAIFPSLFLTGVTHVLLPKDNLKQPSYTLSQNNELVLSNKDFDLYKLKLNQPPQFYFANDTIPGQPDSVTSNAVDSDPFTVFISAIDNHPKDYPKGFTTPKETTIQFRTLTTAHYILDLNVEKPETLIFMDFYNKDWVLYPAPSSLSNPLELLHFLTKPSASKHNIANGHFNSWELDPKVVGSGHVVLHVVYYPQILLYFGLITSLVAFCCLILFYLITVFLRSKHE